MAKDRPVARFQIGYVAAAVWANGDKFFNVTVSRTYKDGDKYMQTDSLGHHDLLNAAECLKRAEAWISESVRD